jgi:hypothetical protein
MSLMLEKRRERELMQLGILRQLSVVSCHAMVGCKTYVVIKFQVRLLRK